MGPPESKSPLDGAELSRDFARLARDERESLSHRIAGLSVGEQADLCLRLPAAQRLEFIRLAPKPMRLVRAIPDGEFYSTVRELGPAGGLALLRLASTAQLRHLLDLESWRGDRFDAPRSGAWVALLAEAGEPLLRRFLQGVDDELLALLYREWIRIEPLEDPSPLEPHEDEDDGAVRGVETPDGRHRLRPRLAGHVQAARALVALHSGVAPQHYLQTVWNAVHELPAEIEEAALRWRQSRLEEHGYPPREEANDVYAPPTGRAVRPVPPEPEDPDGLRAPRAPLRLLGDEALALGLDALPVDGRERALHEVTSVANAVLVADGADTGDPEAHRAALLKATGLIAIALEARGADRPESMAAVVREVPLLELFREGHARAVALQREARRLTGDRGRILERLDSPLRERLEALLRQRPEYYAAGDGGPHACARPFRSFREIEETELALELAQLLGELFPEPAASAALTRFSTALLTRLAWHAARGEWRDDPLPPDVVADLLRNFVSRRTAPPEAAERALDRLVEALLGRPGVPVRQQVLLRRFGHACLEQLAAECGALDPGVPPDRRQVTCLRLL